MEVVKLTGDAELSHLMILTQPWGKAVTAVTCVVPPLAARLKSWPDLMVNAKCFRFAGTTERWAVLELILV